MKQICVVVPFYNEGRGVDTFHRALAPILAGLTGYEVDVVCVDDGSTDDTLDRLLEIAQENTHWRVIQLSRNFGKEAALTAGIDEARGDAVVVLDADLQDPPQLIHQMIFRWENGADVVLAHRSDRRCDSFLKRQTARWFYRLHNLASDIAIPPDVGDCRLMDRRVIEALQRLPERQRFMKGLFCWVGFRTEVIEHERQPRAVGRSKFNGWKLWNLALEGFTSFSTAPLRIWTYVGLACAVFTAAYGLYTLAKTLWWGVEVPGYASILLTILFFGSIQLISLGLIGEYLGRVYLESKQRPVYVVRSRFPAHTAQRPTAARTERRHGKRSLATGLRRTARPLKTGH